MLSLYGFKKVFVTGSAISAGHCLCGGRADQSSEVLDDANLYVGGHQVESYLLSRFYLGGV